MRTVKNAPIGSTVKLRLYPKTKRYDDRAKIIVTEKLDGSNIAFFKKEGVLHIAQRNRVYKWEDIDKGIAYKGLIEWLDEHGQQLEESLYEGACIVGEWIGMGHLKYDTDKKFFMFAKAKVRDDEMIDIQYEENFFIYAFTEQEIPEYVATVPVVGTIKTIPKIEELDELYEQYTTEVGRDVEGFILLNGKEITKYVRMKRGKLEDHYIQGEGRN